MGRPGLIAGDVFLHLCDGLGAMVVEDLGHGRGYAAGDATSEGEVHGALVVVGRALVPAGGAERGHCRMRGSLEQGSTGVCDGVLLDVLELLRLPAEPVLHVLRQAGVVERAFVRVAQDGIDGVVARGDDIALVLATVEDVVEFMVGIGDLESATGCQTSPVAHGSEAQGGGASGYALLGGRQREQELLGTLECLVAGDGVGIGRECQREKQHGE